MRIFFLWMLCLSGWEGLRAQLDSAQLRAIRVFQWRLDIDAAVEKGKYERALHLWVDVLEADPNNPEHYFHRSKLFQRMGDYPAALSDCHILIRLEPESYRGYWRRAELYFLQERYSHTLADLDRALYYADPPQVKSAILFDRGFCYEVQHQYQQAKDDYVLITTLYNPKHVKALHHLGISWNELQQPDSAIVVLKKAIVLEPEKPGAYISLGYSYLLKKDYPTALPFLDRAVELSADDDYSLALALNNRGYCRLRMEQWREAGRDIRKSLTINPEQPFAYRNQALWHQEQGRQKAACRAWKQAQRYGFEKEYGSEAREALESHCPHLLKTKK